MMYKILLIFLITLSFLTHSLQAKTRTCRLVFPERPQDSPKLAYLFDGKESRSVTLPSMNFSDVIQLPDGDITIALTAEQITDPKEIPANAPFLRIPEALTDFYIVILPDPTNDVLPIKMNLIDTGGDKLKAGETLWYNFTEHRILAKLGNADMSVNPGGRTISRDPVPASGYYAARFAYQAGGSGEVAPITEQSWWHDANSRHLGFIVSSGGRLPKIYFYRDFRLK